MAPALLRAEKGGGGSFWAPILREDSLLPICFAGGGILLPQAEISTIFKGFSLSQLAALLMNSGNARGIFDGIPGSLSTKTRVEPFKNVTFEILTVGSARGMLRAVNTEKSRS
jgi:hypothetical protein